MSDGVVVSEELRSWHCAHVLEATVVLELEGQAGRDWDAVDHLEHVEAGITMRILLPRIDIVVEARSVLIVHSCAKCIGRTRLTTSLIRADE